MYKTGFKLSYKPPFLKDITQNQRIIICDRQLYKIKQMRLGEGLHSAGFGYDCHLFFPYMPTQRPRRGQHIRQNGGKSNTADRPREQQRTIELTTYLNDEQ